MATGGIIRLEDKSDHGGEMVTATGPMMVNGKPVCVSGDRHSCPIPFHGTTEVIGTGEFMAGNKRVIVAGDVAGCGAILTQGSLDTITNKQE